MTPKPVRFLGQTTFRKIPFARLADVQTAARLSTERDLRKLPTPISGGDRKALRKAIAAQRGSPAARLRHNPWEAAYGMMALSCACGHITLFDATEAEARTERFRCDRCHKSI